MRFSRILCFLLSLLMTLGLVGCASPGDNSPPPPSVGGDSLELASAVRHLRPGLCAPAECRIRG